MPGRLHQYVSQNKCYFIQGLWIVRTPDFIAFRLANFGGVFSYGQPSCPTLGPSRAGSICVCRADLGFLEEAFAFSCAAASGGRTLGRAGFDSCARAVYLLFACCRVAGGDTRSPRGRQPVTDVVATSVVRNASFRPCPTIRGYRGSIVSEPRAVLPAELAARNSCIQGSNSE
jgi:hypothetical protein